MRNPRRAGQLRVLGAVATASVILGSVVAAATAGADTPSSQTVGRLVTSNGRLDYSKDEAGRLRPLTPDFIAQSLGPNFADFASPRPLGAGDILGAGQALAGPTGPARPVNPVTTPTLQCVNGHQTADPESPPCVDQFTGDNGGATYQGVTPNEVRVLYYTDASFCTPGTCQDPPAEQEAAGSYWDLSQPSQGDENYQIRGLRAFQDYFNRHYQLYGRKLRIIVYVSDRSTDAHLEPDQTRRDDAIMNYFDVRPFAAVFDGAGIGGQRAYLDAMAAHGVVGFTGYEGEPAAFYAAHNDLIWGYAPSVERQADLYASYVCQKVVGRPVVASGDASTNGKPRRLGLIHTANSQLDEFGALAGLVKRKIEACGGHIDAEATYPSKPGVCFQLSVSGGFPGYGFQQMQDFRARGITTILWPGCPDDGYVDQAFALGYHPEWIVAGDGAMDTGPPGLTVGSSMAEFDGHALLVSPFPYQPAVNEQYCYQAQHEVDKDLGQGSAEDACDSYALIRQVATAVELAGPKLRPAGVRAGFRSLPSSPSADPQVPQCSFPPGDNTCIKDGEAEIYSAKDSCWRALEGGRRYLPSRWPDGNIDAQVGGDEPCNHFSGNGSIQA